MSGLPDIDPVRRVIFQLYSYRQNQTKNCTHQRISGQQIQNQIQNLDNLNHY